MRTAAVIAALLGSVVVASIAVFAALVWWAGWLFAFTVSVGLIVLVLAGYAWVVRPWHLRWGATDDEVARDLPGDELVPAARSVTRAISIDATADQVWPWLVQLGYRRAGWYSYDWIDNDGVPSAARVMPEFQQLDVGDTILMAPDVGFEVRSVERPRHIVGLLADGPTSWYLGIAPVDGGVRLVSRWRPTVDRSLAGLAMLAIVEPGTFVMERKMLRTMKQRIESTGSEQVTA